MTASATPKWTRESILDGIRAVAEDGVACSSSADRLHPSLVTMARRRFGSWAAACTAAGVRAVNDVPDNPDCRVAGCGKAPRSRTAAYCEMHYGRLRRNGDPTALASFRDRAPTSNGYVRVRQRTHAVVQGNYWPFEHRVVLYDAIGPGTHACHWCGTPVSWERGYPEHLDALVVDHLDADTTNNDVANLVPSCFRCNFDRGRQDATDAVLEVECVA